MIIQNKNMLTADDFCPFGCKCVLLFFFFMLFLQICFDGMESSFGPTFFPCLGMVLLFGYLIIFNGLRFLPRMFLLFAGGILLWMLLQLGQIYEFNNNVSLYEFMWILFSPKSLFPWIIFLSAAVVGFYPKMYSYCSKLLVVLLPFMFLVFFITLDLSHIESRYRFFGTLNKTLLCNLFIVTAFLYADRCRKEGLFNINIVYLFLLGYITIATASRSFGFQIIAAVLIPFFFFSYKFSWKSFIFFFLVVVAFFVAWNYFDISYMWESFVGRFSEDTRSEQLSEFFEENSLLRLATIGYGPIGSWHFSFLGEPYMWVDGGFLLLSFNAGLPFVLLSLLFILLPVWYNFKHGLLREDAASISVIVVWLLVMMGIALYCTSSVTMYFAVIGMGVGRQWYIAQTGEIRNKKDL